MLDFETSAEGLKSYVTSEGAVSHNVYTINSSPLLVTKYIFMPTIILNNYKIVASAFKDYSI